MPRWFRLSLPLLALCLASCADDGGDQRSCRIERDADLPMLTEARRPAIEATLDGQKVAMLIDTGAQFSMITPDAAQRFNLRPAEGDPHMRISGVGGSEDAPIVTLRDLVLGQGHSRRIELPVAFAPMAPVGDIPTIGLFGADFMSNYDVDIDVPNHHMALYTLHACGARIAPFQGPYFEIPFTLTRNQIHIEARVNGMPIPMLLDTGAFHTLIDRPDARMMGLTDALLSHDRFIAARGKAADELDQHVHRFASLEIGAEELNNFPFSVGASYVGGSLLGDDFLAHNRVWISYPRRMIYAQPAANDPLMHQVK